MAVTLGKNLSSLRVSRQLDANSQRLSSTFERLSSGLRINSAVDDPAGLAVSSKLQADARVMNRARLNLNDATSLLNVADGALGQVSSLLTRMSELAAQSANGSFSLTQRISLNKESQALDQEIRRITAGTTFNDLNIFRSGEFSESSVLLANGDGAFNLASLGEVSDNGRYAQYGAGFAIADYYTIRDRETGDSYVMDLNTDIGSVVSSSVLEVTDSGLAILGVNTGSGTNLYSYDFATATYTALTATATSDTFAADGVDVSADGRTLVFSSQTIYADEAVATSGGTAGAAYRLYSLDLTTGIVRTNGTDLNARLSRAEVSGDGTQVAYLTTASTTALYTADLTSRVSSATLVNSAVGATITNLTLAGIRDTGEVIFASNNNLVGNGNSYSQFFMADPDAGTLMQLTAFEQSGTIANVKLSTDASTLFFTSTGNYTGENADARTQLFRLDTSIGELEQLSGFTSSDPAFGNIRTTTTGRMFVIETAADDVIQYDFSENAVNFDFKAGNGAEGRILTSIANLRESLSFLGSLSLSSQSASQDALDEIELGMEALSQVRGSIGAGLSRLGIANEIAESLVIEFDAAISRIRDVDVARETAELVRLNILQQSGAALLAQTNLQPNLAVQLISGAVVQ
ncbi:MAG: hypothetical protein KDD70_03420 [Bdellovibrionales bacterium]|nr:hypothetical protein [Bdellovibrionales bacterium]